MILSMACRIEIPYQIIETLTRNQPQNTRKTQQSYDVLRIETLSQKPQGGNAGANRQGVDGESPLRPLSSNGAENLHKACRRLSDGRIAWKRKTFPFRAIKMHDVIVADRPKDAVRYL